MILQFQNILRNLKKKLFYLLDIKEDFPRIEILGSWKFHYTSWRDGVPNMPKVIIRYEDLLDNCYNNFYKIIDFLSKILGFEINTEQLKFSIEFSNFEKLQKNEKKLGFFENSGNTNFFRSGNKEYWKNELSISQIKKIEKEFDKEMKFLGYK